MNKNDLNEARTNPDFLIYLEAAMQNSIKNQNIEMMYEILDYASFRFRRRKNKQNL